MIFPLFTLLPLLFTPFTSATSPQQPLKDITTPTPNPTITSIQSIFSSLSGVTTPSPTITAACCDATCALGLCNGFYGPSHPIVTSHPWRPCHGRGCNVPQGPNAPDSDGCTGRQCPPPTGQTRFVSFTFTQSAEAAPTDAAPTDPAEVYHAAELEGHDQDTIPVIVQDGKGEPVTVLADVELGVLGNFISSQILGAFGVEASSSRIVPLAQGEQVIAQIGQQFTVTPHATINLSLLIGSKATLKQYPNVLFNVFDLPPPAANGAVKWEPEVVLGVKFLKEAAVLKLTDEFAGQGAVEGLPVLVREVQAAVASGGEAKREGWEKDEL